MRKLQLLTAMYYLQIPGNDMNLKLSWEYLLINEVG